MRTEGALADRSWVNGGDYFRTCGVAVDGPPETDLQTAIAHMVTC